MLVRSTIMEQCQAQNDYLVATERGPKQDKPLIFPPLNLQQGQNSGLKEIFPVQSSIFSTRAITRTIYSCLSATIGSTRIARRAGRKHAARATTPRSRATTANVRGSNG